MSVIAEFTIDSGEFVLGEVLSAGGASSVEIERVVPATKRVMPYLWVEVDDTERFESSVRASPAVESLVLLDRLANRSLYRVSWDESIEGLIYGMAEAEATILEASGDDRWQFRIRFSTHEYLSTFNDYCSAHGINFRLTRVYALARDDSEGLAFGLTNEQYEALEVAVEYGYFEVPRGATLADIAAEIGISQQAMSERIRRGVDKVLTDAVLGMR